LSFSSFSEAFLFACSLFVIFFSLSATAVFSAELFLVLCLLPRRHHHHHCFHEFVDLQVVLECLLSFQLLLFGEPQVLLFVPGL
jgi:hypothetical protein